MGSNLTLEKLYHNIILIVKIFMLLKYLLTSRENIIFLFFYL